LLFQSKISIHFWSYAIRHVIYIINRLPSSFLLHNKTPFELVFGYKPNFSNLITFGCLAFAHTLDSGKTKFDKRTSKCIFVGYKASTKGYLPFAIDNTYHGTFNGASTDLSNFDSLVDVNISTQTQDFHQHLSDQNHVIDPLSISSTESVSHNDTLPITVGPVRFSTRLKKPPSYLSHYHYGNISSHSTSTHSTTPYPLQSVLSYSKCSANHTFHMSISAHSEPHSFKEANKLDCWKEAMMEELQALQANNTWSLVQLPSGKPIVGCRWVYKVDGTLEKYKARLVAQGFTQAEGVDFFETFPQLPN